MLIKELCCKADVSKEAIRHYEKLGLLTWKPKQAGSRVYRDYSEDVLERLQYIKLGKGLGFTLKEIKSLLDTYYSSGLSAAEQVAVLQSQVSKIEQQIQILEESKRLLLSKVERIQTKQCEGHKAPH